MPKNKNDNEKYVLEEIVVPFLRDELGYILIDPRFQKIPIRFGRETKYADTVVYVVKNSKKVPHILVETKSPGEPLDWLQAESYAQRLGAFYFLVTDGKVWHWYQTGERQGESRRLEKAPRPPSDVIEHLVIFEDLNELSRIMGQCHDIIRNEEGLDPTLSFDEISKLLFTKMQDEREVEQGFKDNEKRELKEDYEFKIKKDELPEDVGKRIKNIFERAKNKFPEIFASTSEDIRYIKLRFPTIYQIVKVLQGYNLLDTAIDIKGATYEMVVKGTFTGKGLGQFFTPREVVEFMVDMVEPKRNHHILDPACGSGGFLTITMQRVWSDIDEVYRQRGLDNPKQEKYKFATEHLYGIDINERMSWVAKMNMVMHGDGHGGIFQHDGLKDSERIEPILNIIKKYGGFDIILTNPPFGSGIKNQDILSTYQLGRGRKIQLTEVLFLERCLNLLKPSGVLAIVIPDGVLNNPKFGYVRKFIRENSVIQAIISLPRETFIPYGSGTKTSLLFLTKKDIREKIRQGKVFIAVAKGIGYDATGRATVENELPDILETYKKKTIGKKADKNERYWIELEKKLENRLDPHYYSPVYTQILKKLNRSPFPLKKLKDIFEKINRGSQTPKPNAYTTKEKGGVLFLRIQNVQEGYIDLTGARYIKKEIHQQLKKSHLSPGDVVMSLTGTIGRLAVIPHYLKECNMVDNLLRIRLKKEIDPEYFVIIMQSDFVKMEIERALSGQNQPKLIFTDLNNILIPVPPLFIQKRIVKMFRKQQVKIDSLRQQIKELSRNLNKAIEKEVFQ